MIVLVAYIRPIFSEWAYSDELDLFNTQTLGEHIRRDGNLVGALIYTQISIKFINSLSDLLFFRLISLISLFIVIIILTRLIGKTNKSIFVQLILPIALLLPAPMTFISWGGIWAFSIATLMSIIACTFWLYGETLRRALSPVLLTLSILIYPISAFSSFSFVAVVLVLGLHKSAHFVQILKDLIRLFAISGLFAISALLVSRSVGNLEFNQRVSFVDLQSLPQKLQWLISRPVAVSTRFFDIRSPAPLDALLVFLFVVVIILLGLWRQSQELKESFFTRSSLYFVSVFLSLTPLVVTSSNQIEFRYILGISLCFFVTTIYFIAVFFRNMLPIGNYVIFSVLLIVGVSSVLKKTDEQFIQPYKTKEFFLSNVIDDCISKSGTVSRVIVNQAREPFPSRPNLGIFSQTTDLASPWVPEPSVKIMLKKKGLVNVDVIIAKEHATGPVNSCEINLQEFKDIIDSQLNQ